MNSKTEFSFEVFPPKKMANIEVVYTAIKGLKVLNPSFISVTYGAGGSENCQRTLEIAKFIKDECRTPSVPHLTCINMNKSDIDGILKEFIKNNILSLLALRGDVVDGYPRCSDFLHASSLVEYIRQCYGDKFFIYGACYPEGHPDSKDLDEDIKNLKLKVEMGVNRLLTQLFFDNDKYSLFLEKVRKAGINIPIEAGIMCVTSEKSLKKMIGLSNCTVPNSLKTLLDKYASDDKSMREAGIEYAINQIQDLKKRGVSNVHLYTMNSVEIAKKIVSAC